MFSSPHSSKTISISVKDELEELSIRLEKILTVDQASSYLTKRNPLVPEILESGEVEFRTFIQHLFLSLIMDNNDIVSKVKTIRPDERLFEYRFIVPGSIILLDSSRKCSTSATIKKITSSRINLSGTRGVAVARIPASGSSGDLLIINVSCSTLKYGNSGKFINLDVFSLTNLPRGWKSNYKIGIWRQMTVGNHSISGYLRLDRWFLTTFNRGHDSDGKEEENPSALSNPSDKMDSSDSQDN